MSSNVPPDVKLGNSFINLPRIRALSRKKSRAKLCADVFEAYRGLPSAFRKHGYTNPEVKCTSSRETVKGSLEQLRNLQ